MAQACELLRASDRSSSHAAIAGDTSNATIPTSARSTTTSSNNCAIKTLCAPGNTGNPRRRPKYYISSRALQGDWRAANSNNTTPLQEFACRFDPFDRRALRCQRKSVCLFARRLFFNCHKFQLVPGSRDRTSTCRANSSSSREGNARRPRRFNKTCTTSPH